VSIIVENIPSELRELPQWLLWRRELRGDKPTKIPYQPCGIKNAKSNDPATWCNFEEAIAVADKFDGIGFVFSPNDPFIGIDLDHCVDPTTGQILPWSPEQIAACKHWSPTIPDPEQIIAATESYAEFSPSGSGVHIIIKGQLPKGMKRGDFEAYKIGRYFSVTGKRLPSSPPTIATFTGLGYLCGLFDTKVNEPKASRKPRQQSPNATIPTVDQVIAKARTATNAAAFDRLFFGDTIGYPSHSEADAALCGIVAFYCCADATLLDSVFRQSKLYRDKWDEQHSGDGRTYGEMTADNAIAGCREFYDWTHPGKPVPKTYSLGPATFVVKSIDHTPKKTSVTLELLIDNKPIDVITFTTAGSNRANAVKAIKAKCFCGDDPTTLQQIDNLLGIILVDASRPQPEQPKADDRPPEAKDTYDIIKEIIPPIAKLVYRTDSGKAYSRLTHKEMSKTEFTSLCMSNDIVIAAGKAFDAPRHEDESLNRPKFIPILKQEMEVLWGDLFRALPAIDKAELTADDEAIREFRQKIIDLWTRPCTMHVHAQKAANGQPMPMASKSSLASSVLRMKEKSTVEFMDKWHRIHEAYEAYYREYAAPETGGEIWAFLGMKFELFGQVNVKPGKITKHTFKSMAETHGCSDPSPAVPVRMSGGSNLIVLSRLMTARILSKPLTETKNKVSEEPQAFTDSPDPSEDTTAVF